MRRLDGWLLAAAVVLTLAVTLPWAGKLGMEYDEAHFLPTAARIAFGAEERLNPPWGVTIAGRPIPVVTMPYVGTLDAFLYAGAYRVMGPTVWASRSVNLVLLLAVLVAVWWVARREAGLWGIGLALGILWADVEWVLHSVVHFGPFLLQQLFAVLAIGALQEWWGSGKVRWMWLAAGLLALGFHEKFTFIWVVSGLVLAVLVFEARKVWQLCKWWHAVVGLVVVLVVVSPLLYFIASAPEVVFGFSGAKTAGGRDWGLILEDRWKVWLLMLRGTYFVEFTAGTLPEKIQRGWGLVALCGLGLVLALMRRHRLALILYTTAIGVWCWNLVFPDAGRVHHLLLTVPLWPLGAAMAVAASGQQAKALALGLLIWCGYDAGRCYVAYAQQVDRTHGVNFWSELPIELVQWLNESPKLELVTTSWGVEHQVTALTGGRVKAKEFWVETLSDAIPAEAAAQMLELMRKERQVWVKLNVMTNQQEQWDRVVKLAAEHQMQPVLVKTFRARNGVQELAAYRFAELGTEAVAWRAAEGMEFSLDSGMWRMDVAGVATTDGESLNVEWLDVAGKVLMTDERNLYWAPLIHGSQQLEFTPAYWPKGFVRKVVQEDKPARVRVAAQLKQAKIVKVEVAQ